MADPNDPLLKELLSRAVRGDSRVQDPLKTSLSVFDSRIPADFAIQKALLALKGLGYTGTILPRVNSWDEYPSRALDSRPANQRPNGWVQSDDPTKVHVLGSGTDYQNALKGNPDAIKTLAALIAHEDVHTHQPNDGVRDEGPAYAKQIEILKLLKAPRSVIEQMQAVANTIAPPKRK